MHLRSNCCTSLSLKEPIALRYCRTSEGNQGLGWSFYALYHRFRIAFLLLSVVCDVTVIISRGYDFSPAVLRLCKRRKGVFVEQRGKKMHSDLDGLGHWAADRTTHICQEFWDIAMWPLCSVGEAQWLMSKMLLLVQDLEIGESCKDVNMEELRHRTSWTLQLLTIPDVREDASVHTMLARVNAQAS